jgi:hypothetical protein
VVKLRVTDRATRLGGRVGRIVEVVNEARERGEDPLDAFDELTEAMIGLFETLEPDA